MSMPRELILLRHAKAEVEGPDGTDFSRPLAPRGERVAMKMATALAELAEWRPSLWLTSPAPRALRTAELIRRPEDVPLTHRPELYEATLGRLVGVVQQAPAEAVQLVLTGHNNGLSDLAAWLDAEGWRWELPTCGVAWFRIELPSWRALAPGTGRRVRGWTPEALGFKQG